MNNKDDNLPVDDIEQYNISYPVDNIQFYSSLNKYHIRREDTTGYWSEWFEVPNIVFNVIFVISKINKAITELFGG